MQLRVVQRVACGLWHAGSCLMGLFVRFTRFGQTVEWDVAYAK